MVGFVAAREGTCLFEMAWNLPRFSDLGFRYHLRWFVGREDCRWQRVERLAASLGGGACRCA
jgi:hypothetical protein